jgi:hypothetical protein
MSYSSRYLSKMAATPNLFAYIVLCQISCFVVFLNILVYPCGEHYTRKHRLQKKTAEVVGKSNIMLTVWTPIASACGRNYEHGAFVIARNKIIAACGNNSKFKFLLH